MPHFFFCGEGPGLGGFDRVGLIAKQCGVSNADATDAEVNDYVVH